MSYATINAGLRRAFSNIIKKICTEKIPAHTTSKDERPLKVFLAFRVIPLDKNRDSAKDNIKKAAGCLELCTGQKAECESAILFMEYSNPVKQRQYCKLAYKIILIQKARKLCYLTSNTCVQWLWRFSTTSIQYLLDSLLLVEKNWHCAKEQQRVTKQRWEYMP